MNRKLFVLALLVMFVMSGFAVQAQDRVQIVWFVGLGTGTSDQQIEVQNQVVEDFNASQDEIELVIHIAADWETSRDTISTLIAAGDAPQIVGPVGVGGGNVFADQWADLQPLIDASGYDTSIYGALADLYRRADGTLVGLPFALFPAVTFYNRGLFDEAGLNYPPQEFGAPYVWEDGTEVPWNYDTAREIAMILTVDGMGYDATMDEFDPANIVQFGLNFQWAGQRLQWTDLQPEIWYDAETNTIDIPESWYTANQWLQDAVWTDHFMPSETYNASELFGAGNVFQTGNLGMAIVPTWYTCCLGEAIGKFEFDFAVVPQSFDGEYHVAMDMDTFRLVDGADNLEEAFTVLTYLVGEATSSLAPVYGAFPSLEQYQQPWMDAKEDQYQMGANWQVIVDSLAYANPVSMHHESATPNYQKGTDRVAAFGTLLYSDAGADIDVAAELDAMAADLQAIVEE